VIFCREQRGADEATRCGMVNKEINNSENYVAGNICCMLYATIID